MRRTCALLLLLSVGCSKNQNGGRNESLDQKTQGSSAAPAATPADTPAGGALTGTILEQIPAGGYRYLRLRTESGELWAAVSDVPVEVGATVTIQDAMPMEHFESKTLNRTFDRIYFGMLDAPGSAPSTMPGTPSSTGTPAASKVDVGHVDPARGADAHTIGDLWKQKDQLAGKTVSIRGVVVKYNPGVMGRNWIHLQDGSGDAASGTHDITVTSMDPAAMNATVTITGTVRLDRNFGAGYTYPLIIEDAKVVAK